MMRLNIQGYLLKRVIKTGMIIPFGGSSAPEGYLICDGSAISRSLYKDLFDVIGTAYGSGDGTTTFNLPNFNDKVAQGNNRGSKSAGLPNITGRTGIRNNGATPYYNGCFYGTNNTTGAYAWDGAGTYSNAVTFDASRSSSIYGASTTVQPPACLSNFCIKY